MRVRTIIASWNYPNLLAAGLVPDMASTLPSLVTKRYPPWVYAAAKTDPNFFAMFGSYMEQLVVHALVTGQTTLSTEEYTQHWTAVSHSPIPEAIPKAHRYFEMILKGLVKTRRVGSNLLHEHELADRQVTGHPDILDLDSHTIVDVKTTSKFASMAEGAYLQILAYVALARVEQIPITHVGLILPLQREWILWDIQSWNSASFLELLQQGATWCMDDQLAQLPMVPSQPPLGVSYSGPYMTIHGTPGYHLHSSVVGGHVAKPDLADKMAHADGRPLQVFMSNPRGKSKKIPRDLPPVGNCRLFIHAPYIINLCHRNDEDLWDVTHLEEQLDAAHDQHCCGVVVHVGKSEGHPSISVATDVMRRNVLQVLTHATTDCPLIIETPAGQGSELLTTLETFYAFYASLSEYHDRLKVCVDSCHVFASGYDPVWYLTQWDLRFPGAVILVHFNDSETERGSFVDRHQPAGLGHIGIHRMTQLHEYCRVKKIPMVLE